MAATDDIRLSLCMIVRNEAFFIEDCLSRAAPHVDEIILVDTGSSDDTVALAGAFTDNIHHFDWCDDFAAARNFSLEQATGDWIVVLDADEVIGPDDWQTLRRVATAGDKDAYLLQQRNYSHEPQMDDWLPVLEPGDLTRDYPGYKPNPIYRLFRNRPDIRYRGRVHEVIDESVPAGRGAALDVPIHHYQEADPTKPKDQRQLNYLRLIEARIEGESDPRLLMAAGSIRMTYLKDYPGALAHFERVLELRENDLEARKFIALAQYLSGDLERAFASYLALYQDGCREVTVALNLANLAVKRGQFSRARALLEELVATAVLPAATLAQLQGNIRYLSTQVDKN